MNVNAIVTAARASRNWTPIVELVPYACFLGVRLDIKGDQFTACMPFDPKLIGNPALPALHGGATGGFLECAGMFYLLWHMDSADLPKTINFTFEYLRSGRPEDVYANVFMVQRDSVSRTCASRRGGPTNPSPSATATSCSNRRHLPKEIHDHDRLPLHLPRRPVRRADRHRHRRRRRHRPLHCAGCLGAALALVGRKSSKLEAVKAEIAATARPVSTLATFATRRASNHDRRRDRRTADRWSRRNAGASTRSRSRTSV
jgi:acyl-coenzyme A thioesterase PaaI-like protein